MAGPNLEEKNDEGETALMRACVFGKTKVVAMLLAHGAELETTDVLGTTALMLACANVGRVRFSVVVCSFVRQFVGVFGGLLLLKIVIQHRALILVFLVFLCRFLL